MSRASRCLAATLTALSAVALSAGLSAAEEPPVGDASKGFTITDGVAARVNGVPLTRREVFLRVAPSLARAQAQKKLLVAEGRWTEADEKAYLEGRAGLFRQAIATMAVERVALHEADKQKVAVNEDDVDSRVEHALKRAGGPEAFLKKHGMNRAQLAQMVRRQLRIQRARRINSPARVDVRPSELREHYRANADKYVRPESYRLRVITIHRTTIEAATGTQAPREGARDLAETILRQARAAPALFEDLARKHSDDKRTAAAGGLLSSSGGGFVTSDRIAAALRTAAQTTEPGSVSDLIEAEGSYHFLKVEERREAGIASFDEVQGRIRAELRNKLHMAAQRRWIEHLIERAHIVDGLGRPISRDFLLKAAFAEEGGDAG